MRIGITTTSVSAAPTMICLRNMRRSAALSRRRVRNVSPADTGAASSCGGWWEQLPLLFVGFLAKEEADVRNGEHDRHHHADRRDECVESHGTSCSASCIPILYAEALSIPIRRGDEHAHCGPGGEIGFADYSGTMSQSQGFRPTGVSNSEQAASRTVSREEAVDFSAMEPREQLKRMLREHMADRPFSELSDVTFDSMAPR